jgi:hypothetical protein
MEDELFTPLVNLEDSVAESVSDYIEDEPVGHIDPGTSPENKIYVFLLKSVIFVLITFLVLYQPFSRKLFNRIVFKDKIFTETVLKCLIIYISAILIQIINF